MEVDHKTISDLNDLQDRIRDWVNHHRQPKAYFAPAQTLGELAERLTEIADRHLSHTEV